MSIHYNAFISYRHHPDDIKVASTIHKSLEHYRLPKAIRSKTKGIKRIFRDKEELPITSNLTDDITAALENSDYLIVICSEHTKESIWVQREIETFLKTHPKNKVLTVLASGEPYDTIPEILQYEEHTDPVSGEITRTPIEPLSCDWRQKKRKAMQEELPRLAAVLLGCGYDELRQRLRQYRMRRTIALFSGALALCMTLTGYFIYTSIQIQQANDQLSLANAEIQKANDQLEDANITIQNNLDQAMINQSKFLASSAQERLAAGDRLTAIELALAALPTKESPRPYVTEAEYALSVTTGLYQGYNFLATAVLSPGGMIKDFCLSDNGRLLYVLDSRDVITIYDTTTFLPVNSISAGFQVDSFFAHDMQHLILINTSSDFIVCMDPEGTELWRLDHVVDYAVSEEFLYVLFNDYSAYNDPAFIYQISLTDGSHMRDPIPLAADSDGAIPSDIAQETVVPGQPLVLKYYHYTDSDYVALDPETAQLRSIMNTTLYLRQVYIADNGDILFMLHDNSGSINGVYHSLGMTITSPSYAEIQCYQADSLAPIWTTKINSYLYGSLSTLASIPKSNHLFCQKDNIFMILDGSSGQILSQCQAPTIPISVIVDEEKVNGVLSDGSYYEYRFDDNSCTSVSFMENELAKAEIDFNTPNGATYYVSPHSSTQIHVYKYTCDNDWQLFSKESDVSLSTKASLSSGDFLAHLGWNELSILNIPKKEIIVVSDVTSSNGNTLTAISEDGTYVWIGNNSENVICVEASTGAVTKYVLPIPLDKGRVSTRFHFAEDKLYYVCSNDAETNLCTWDPVTEECQIVAVEEGKNSLILRGVTEDFSIVTDKDQKVVLISHKTGNQQILSDVASPICAIAENTKNGQYAVSISNAVIILDKSGNSLSQIALTDYQAVSMYYYENILYVLCDNGMLYRYSAEGKLIDKIALDIYETFFTKVQSQSINPGDISWTALPDSEILLNIFHAGNLISHENGGVRAYILNCHGYDPSTNSFLVFDDRGIGVYQKRDLQQVIAIAKDTLKGFALTQEQKDYYGIS